MLALVWCVIMKIVEVSSASRAQVLNDNINNNNNNNNNILLKSEKGKYFKNSTNERNNKKYQNNKNRDDFRRNNLNSRVNNINNVWRMQYRVKDWRRRKRFKDEEKKLRGLPSSGRGGGMSEDLVKGTNVPSPEDFNSNNNGETTASYVASYVSNASSQHEGEFIQDNSEYQWFLDYGYREGLQHQVSVLSSLSDSYSHRLLSSSASSKGGVLYDDLSRNIDANLAEVDMENFRSEDIHSLLYTLPTMCGLEGEDSAGSTDAMSICKSELLFSPVKETPLPGTINFSVDSLDSDIMLTCQANKDNYTIAFEGSTIMGSEESEEYQENAESGSGSSEGNNWPRSNRLVNPALAAIAGAERCSLLNSSLTSPRKGTIGCGRPNCKQLTASQGNMARSDSVFTTWSKLNGEKKSQHPLEQQQLSRHPSGNNNTRIEGTEDETTADNSDQAAVKSRSLPNLARQQLRRQRLRTNLVMSTSSSAESSCVKLYDVRSNGSPLTSSGASSCSGGRPLAGLSLVRLFMKQRSGSGTDHSSSASDGWDSDSCVRSATCPQQWHTNSQSYRNKHVFQSCQGVESRNDNSVDECQCLTEDNTTTTENKTRDPESLTCGHPRRSTNGWVQGEEIIDCSACTFEDSLCRLEENAQRTHEQIAEEEIDGPSEQSESVEQVSESISKIMERDATMENVRNCDDCSNYSSHHGKELKTDQCHCKVSGDRANLNNNNSLEDFSRRGSCSSNCECSEAHQCKRNSATQYPVSLINRSMQTSCILDVLARASLVEVRQKSTESPTDTDSEKTNIGATPDKVDKGTKPIYVYYPNYALPDLGFLKEKQEGAKVYLRPQKFSTGPGTDEANLISKIPACLRQPKMTVRQKRPFSCNDIEGLRKKGFDHVRDWESLTMLLPKEYRQVLAEVPEVVKHVDEKTLKENDVQPLFCVSSSQKRFSHPGCDCTNLSSASSSNTQPSSGYRGSSTLLIDSSSHTPSYNPLYVYRYDSVSSEASLMDPEGSRKTLSCQGPPLPKRSISLPGAKDPKKHNVEIGAPPRPPLPKGILRNAVDESPSSIKMRKDAVNKRYSMFEMGGTTHGDNAGKRTSLQEPYYLSNDRKGRRRSHSEDTAQDENADVENRFHHHCCSHAEFEDVLRLSDYIHMSTTGLQEASVESEWDNEKMARLRLQVSRFLSANGPEAFDSQPSKTVTFASPNKARSNVASIELKTPPNSPNVSALLGTGRPYKLQQPLSDLPIREEDPGDSSADERFPSPSRTVKTKPDLEHKKVLVNAISEAVEEIIGHFSGATTPGECARLGDSGFTPAVANSVLGVLCPALYAVLSDGLLPTIATAFGDISNSVWQVVEGSAQQGPMTRSLNELVLRLNSEDVFSEGLLKFNAFVMGLLNVRSVDAWAGYLRTRESILRKHYGPDALLLLSSRGGPSFRALTDRLLAALRPLALLPFKLDLLYECRQLHQSLQRLGAAAATSPTSLLRLVRSIQNSVGQLTIQEEHSDRKGIHSDNSTAQEEPGPPSTPLTKRIHLRALRRPRSCIDPTADPMDAANSVRKRWSGVQLGSKLSQALDRLMAEDTEEDYSDSLNSTTPQGRPSDHSTGEDATLISRDSDMDTDLSDRSGAAARAKRATAMGNGGKFKRLQMKWEKLSGSGTETREHSARTSPEASPTKGGRGNRAFRTSPAMSPVKSSSRSSLHSPGSSTSSMSSTSRIPRPVTSPVRPSSGIPVLQGRSATSPTQNWQTPPQRKPNLPIAPLKRQTSITTRTSRVDQNHAPLEQRSPATRPSSLPYSPVSNGHSDSSKRGSQRRANSASVSRPAQGSRKPKPVQRYVRTIKHQLASDSGHLSFSAGERLSLVLEVDEMWLLCCRGDRKGLVRRSAVVAIQDHTSRF